MITVRDLKERIKDLPDDMPVVHLDDMSYVDVQRVEVEEIFPLAPGRKALVLY
jgi:hypothetical protein